MRRVDHPGAMLTLSALFVSLGLLLPPHPPQAPPPRPVPAPAVAAHTPANAPRAATWPLAPAPEVVTDFDPPSAVWGAGHRGVDLLGAPDQPVLAAMAGRVSFAGTIAGRGVVVIEHGSVRTTYEPVLAQVRTGEQVPAGGVIGRLQTGRSHCVPRTCLHWGLLEGREYLDPLSLLGRGPVRLLPN